MKKIFKKSFLYYSKEKNSVFVNNIISGGETNQIYKYTPEVQYDTNTTTGNVSSISNGVLSLTTEGNNDKPKKLKLVSSTGTAITENTDFADGDLVLLKHQTNADENGVYKYIPVDGNTPAKLVKQDITINPGKFDFSKASLLDNKIYDSTEEGIGYFEGVTNDTKIEGFQSTLERDGIEILQEKKKALVKLFGDVYGLNDLKKDSEKNEFDLINSIKDNKTTPKDFMKDDVTHFTGDGKIKDDFDPESSITGTFIELKFIKDSISTDGTVIADTNNGLFNQGKTALVAAKTAADATDPAPAADVVDKNKYYKKLFTITYFPLQ